MLKMLTKVKRTLIRIGQSPELTRWYDDDGDKTLRLNYELDENSIVFDLGGYEGQWASDIFSKYCCHIYIFEPVSAYYQSISKRFCKNGKISCYNYGLAGRNYECDISLDENGSSIFKKAGSSQKIVLLKAGEFLHSNGIDHIDLIKINIEGSEYDLVEHLIESGRINDIKNLQVQFHKFVHNAVKRMEAIQKQLSKTHELTYQYLCIWENWRRKN